MVRFGLEKKWNRIFTIWFECYLKPRQPNLRTVLHVGIISWHDMRHVRVSYNIASLPYIYKKLRIPQTPSENKGNTKPLEMYE